MEPLEPESHGVFSQEDAADMLAQVSKVVDDNPRWLAQVSQLDFRFEDGVVRKKTIMGTILGAAVFLKLDQNSKTLQCSRSTVIIFVNTPLGQKTTVRCP